MTRISAERPRSHLKSSNTTRTVIVDDHPLFRDGFRELLAKEPALEICGEAESENEAYALVQETDADLVTVDVSLASGNGFNLVSRIKRHKPTTIVLMISMYDERVYAERALAAGAAGYVCKQSTNREILHAVHTVRNGEIYLRPDILQRLLKRKASPIAAPADAEQAVLSDRELEILGLIGQGKRYSANLCRAALGRFDGGNLPRTAQIQARLGERRRIDALCDPLADESRVEIAVGLVDDFSSDNLTHLVLLKLRFSIPAAVFGTPYALFSEYFEAQF